MEAQELKRPFLSASAYMSDRFGISLPDDEFVEKAYHIWREIGNIAQIIKSTIAYVPEDLAVELPEDCEFVESVTTAGYKNSLFIANSQSRIQYGPQGKISEEEPIVGAVNAESAARVSEHYNYGETVEYKLENNALIVLQKSLIGYPLTIKYSTIRKDSDGLPMLSNKEIEAIAVNMALREAEKRFFMGEKGADKLVSYLKAEADRLMVYASIPEKINDDELDKLLDTMFSWDRKTYGNRFNLIK